MTIEAKVNELASEVMSGEMLASFLLLPVKDKLVGIATFAHISGESEVRDMCLEAMNYV